MKRIGMLTSGGDCQALNAAMRGVVKGLSKNVEDLEVYGFYEGYKGLIYGSILMIYFCLNQLNNFSNQSVDKNIIISLFVYTLLSLCLNTFILLLLTKIVN